MNFQFDFIYGFQIGIEIATIEDEESPLTTAVAFCFGIVRLTFFK